MTKPSIEIDKFIEEGLDPILAIKKHLDLKYESKYIGRVRSIGTPEERVLSIINNAIEKQGVIEHNDLLRKCWRFLKAEGLIFVVETLVREKKVDRAMVGRKIVYGPLPNA